MALAGFRRAVLVGGLSILPSVPPAVAQSRELFAADEGNTSIRVFDAAANGNVAPLRVIQGGNTQLSLPSAVQYDGRHGEIVVANRGNNSITVYGRLANGNTPPLRRIAGGATGLNINAASVYPSSHVGLFVDAVNDEIGVVNAAASPPSITIYSRLANGNVAPLRTIQGAATTLASPNGIDVDTVNDEILVALADGGCYAKVLVFSRTATGDVAPLRALNSLTSSVSCGVNIDVKVDPPQGEMIVTKGSVAIVYARTASGADPYLRVFYAQAFAISLDSPNREVFSGLQTQLSAAAPNSGDTQLRKIVGAATGFVGPVRGVAVGPLRAVSVSNPYQLEGAAGTASLAFELSLWAPSGQPVIVDYATADGTATAPADYVSAAGTVTFNPGETSKTVTVSVKGDTSPEAYETIFLNLSNPTGAMLANARGTGTIIDDDTSPADPAVVYRLRHPSIGAYLYTVYPYERDAAQFLYGYIFEGSCCKWLISPAGDGRGPLYRLYSGSAGEYFFTNNAAERDGAVAQFGYVYEGVAAYCHPAASPGAPTAWYRLRYGNKHFYTIYTSERDAAVQQYGYTYEGVSCYRPAP